MGKVLEDGDGATDTVVLPDSRTAEATRQSRRAGHRARAYYIHR